MAIFQTEFLSQSSWFPIDGGTLFSPFVPSLLLLLFTTGFLKFNRRRSHWNSPPSTPKLPIIGNLHQLSRVPHRSLHSLSNKSVNLSQTLLETSFNITSTCIIGKKAKEDRNFGDLSKRLVKLLTAFSFGDLFPRLGWLDVLTGLIGRLKENSNELDAFLESVIEMQIKSLENNMVGEDHNQKDIVQSLLHLVQTDQNTRLTRDNIKAILLVSS
ncbi:hypothetical protein V6N13_142597 [Hibiscus sabdariffa]